MHILFLHTYGQDTRTDIHHAQGIFCIALHCICMAINTVELGWIQRVIIDGDIVQIQALCFRVFLGRFQLFVSIPHFISGSSWLTFCVVNEISLYFLEYQHYCSIVDMNDI